MATPQGEEQSHESKEFNKEEIERLQYFLSTLDKPSLSSTCSLLHSRKPSNSHALNAFDISFKDLWIIDSGTIDHMTPSSWFFYSYSPCSNNKKSATADGSLIIVTGIGEIKITPSLIFKNTLHVPKLSANLLSPYPNYHVMSIAK